MQAIKGITWEGLLQAGRTAGTMAMRRGWGIVLWVECNWEQDRQLLGPCFVQGLCRPPSSFGFCSECVGMSLVEFEQIKNF